MKKPNAGTVPTSAWTPNVDAARQAQELHFHATRGVRAGPIMRVSPGGSLQTGIAAAGRETLQPQSQGSPNRPSQDAKTATFEAHDP